MRNSEENQIEILTTCRYDELNTTHQQPCWLQKIGGPSPTHATEKGPAPLRSNIAANTVKPVRFPTRRSHLRGVAENVFSLHTLEFPGMYQRKLCSSTNELSYLFCPGRYDAYRTLRVVAFGPGRRFPSPSSRGCFAVRFTEWESVFRLTGDEVATSVHVSSSGVKNVSAPSVLVASPPQMSWAPAWSEGLR